MFTDILIKFRKSAEYIRKR